jgi:hypothetical protein
VKDPTAAYARIRRHRNAVEAGSATGMPKRGARHAPVRKSLKKKDRAGEGAVFGRWWAAEGLNF